MTGSKHVLPVTREELRNLNADARANWARWNPAQAGRVALSEEVQLVLANDPDPGVRCALAANPSTTARVQRVLMQDTYWMTRMALAESAALVPELAGLLAEDTDETVVLALVVNEHVELAPSVTGAMEVFELECTLRGSGYVDEALDRAGSDPEAVAALRPNWGGTLTELVETCATFAPTPA
jgi:hypothetical protein